MSIKFKSIRDAKLGEIIELEYCHKCGKMIYIECREDDLGTLYWHTIRHSTDECLVNLKEEIDGLKGQFYVFNERFKGNLK